MKLSLIKIENGEDEVIIKYKEKNDVIKEISNMVLNGNQKIIANHNKEQCMINISDILYVESVDRDTFVYTIDCEYTIGMTLASFMNLSIGKSFFRCSKSMIINVKHIKKLKSLSGNRIDVELVNSEHVIISRRYAREFREMIKGE